MSFEGEIGEIDLIERLVELGGEQFTGAIRFESDGIIKIVYFKEGDVLSASTNDRTDAIDEILQRANKVTREHVKQALAKRKESETLGDALLGLGFITRKELTWARRVQVIGILRSIIGWKTGSYTIVADYLPKREEGTLFSLSQIIVELVVTDNDRSKSEQAMESGNAVFEKAANFDDAFRRLGLNEDAEQIVAQIDGVSTAAEVAGRSGKDVFNVYKLLEALRLLRLVNRLGKPPGEHEVHPPAPAPATAEWDVENPDFTLDDVAPAAPAVSQWAESATMEIPAVSAPAVSAPPWTPPGPAPKPPSSSVWDEPDDSFGGTEIAPPPLAPAAEPQWGFDDAQIEAARRAAVPVTGSEPVPTSIDAPAMKAAKPRSRIGLLLITLVVLILAGAAYPAWLWWQSRSAPEPVVVVRHNPPKLHPADSPKTSTSSTSPATPTTTVTSVRSATTATVTPPIVQTTTAPPPATHTTTAASKQPPAHTTTAAPRPPVHAATASIVAPPVTAPQATRLQRTSAGATITNVPSSASASSPAPGSDAMRSKYDGMARDFAAQKSGNYTVQFELVCETTSITRALAEVGDKVWFVATSYRGRPCYRVFWGRFNSSAEANAATKPAALGKAPVVVKIPR
jgi:cytoskeletal protein RodZ